MTVAGIMCAPGGGTSGECLGVKVFGFFLESQMWLWIYFYSLPSSAYVNPTSQPMSHQFFLVSSLATVDWPSESGLPLNYPLTPTCPHDFDPSDSHPSRSNLNYDELNGNYQESTELSTAQSRRNLVVVRPYSRSKNGVLSPQHNRSTVSYLSHLGHFCMLKPRTPLPSPLHYPANPYLGLGSIGVPSMYSRV